MSDYRGGLRKQKSFHLKNDMKMNMVMNTGKRAVCARRVCEHAHTVSHAMCTRFVGPVEGQTTSRETLTSAQIGDYIVLKDIGDTFGYVTG